MSGIPIHGDAWTWWNQAAGNYQRGCLPVPGAVLVLARTNKLPRGHLAVVTQVLAPRDINVTHTNWGSDWLSRRVTYESVRVQDVSPANDWTSVRFWNDEAGVFGFPYPAMGFIYKARQ
jgi:surface antigen